MKTPIYKTTLLTILLSIALGAGSGVFATALTSNYLSEYALELQNLTTPLRLTQKKPTVFPSSYQEAIDRVQEAALPTVVTLLSKTNQSDGYGLGDSLGSGMILTSDGWVAVYSDRFISAQSVQVLHNRELFKIEDKKTDKITGIDFIKINDHGLPVTTFGSGLDLSLQEQVFLSHNGSDLISANIIEHKHTSGKAVSSDKPTRKIILDREGQVGDPVFNLTGELVGVVDRISPSRSEVIPIDAILPAFSSMLENGKVERAELGVNVLDLTHTIGSAFGKDRATYSGAYIWSFNIGSPAKKAGLKKGDIIISLDGQSVNGYRSLDERLFNYGPGDSVEIVFERKGEELSVEIVLSTK